MADITGKKPSEFSEATAIAIEQKILSVSKWKKYLASFYCDGIDVITVVPLNSTDADYLGNIAWSVNVDDGEVYGDLAGVFITDKTFQTKIPLQSPTQQNVLMQSYTINRVVFSLLATSIGLLEIMVYTE